MALKRQYGWQHQTRWKVFPENILKIRLRHTVNLDHISKTQKDYMKFARVINQAMNLSHRRESAAQRIIIILGFLFISHILTSCTSSSISVTTTWMPSPTPTSTAIPPTSTPIPTATAISPDPPFPFWIDLALPGYLTNAVGQFDFLTTASSGSSAQLLFSQDPGLEAGTWIYLAVAPFYSFKEEIKSADLERCWKSGTDDTLPFSEILVSEETLEVFELLWGSANEDCIEIIKDDLLPQQLWLEQNDLALIPFELTQAAYKILIVDGIDPLSKDFNQSEYPLALRLNYQVPPGILINLSEYTYLTNFDSSKLSSIALTGVTALVRDTANIMETEGITYPAGDIQDILQEADITHINNEVPFAEDCPPPETYQASLRFCSGDSYIELLEAVGTDIVELSGDHFGDWGQEAMFHTLELYNQKGWTVYGGGSNLSDGLAPVYLEHNGNQFAFIGCNGKGIDRYATATEENPGAAQCDFKWMIPEITRLASEGYIVIATMQHEEVDNFGSIALQQYDFRRLAEAGAVIVSGSQSHHPQAIEFTGASFIHYGLGNLFFDQWFLAHYTPKSHINKDKSFIDLHYFYDGNYIGTRLVPLQFIDNARPRPMTIEERTPFLDEFYRHSLWNGEWIYLYSTGYMQDRIDQ